MNPAPLVSIVIPVYNGANYLADAIGSALAQTYPSFEVVVVNDGSTDGGETDRIARSFVPRVRYFSQPNGGVAAALNRGIRESHGELISWLSHDDLLLPDKLARQVAFLAGRAQERVVVFGDFEVEDVDSGRRFVSELPPRLRRDDVRAMLTLLLLGRLHGCALLLPRRALEEAGEFDPALRTTQDYDLWFRMLAAGWRFVHAPGPVIRTRWHAAQGTRAMSDVHRREAAALYVHAARTLTSQIRALSMRDAVAVHRALAARGLAEASGAFLTAWEGGSTARAGVRLVLEIAARVRDAPSPR